VHHRQGHDVAILGINVFAAPNLGRKNGIRYTPNTWDHPIFRDA
jgi:hypothetical protein